MEVTPPAAPAHAFTALSRRVGAAARRRTLAVLLGLGAAACAPALPARDGGPEPGDAEDDAEPGGDAEDDADERPPVFCAAQWPHETATTAGRPTELLFVRVRIAGVTPTRGEEADLAVEIGYGPASASPDQPSWLWARAEQNPSCEPCGPDEEERMASLTPERAGEYLWAARVVYRGSPPVFCDRADEGRAGSDDGFSPDDAPRLTVTAAPGLRTVSLNLRCLLDDWDARLPLVAAALAAAEPDAIGLQEVCAEPAGRDGLAELLAALADLTGLSYEVHRAVTHRSWDLYDEGLAILTPHRLAAAGSADLPAGLLPRKVLMARLEAPAGSFVAATTHLDHRSEEARAEQAEALLSALSAFASPAEAVVLSGDFNEAPARGVDLALAGAGYLDLWAALRPDEPGYTFPARSPTVRIDYVRLRAGGSGLAPGSIEQILDVPVGGVTGSDHLGLSAGLTR